MFRIANSTTYLEGNATIALDSLNGKMMADFTFPTFPLRDFHFLLRWDLSVSFEVAGSPPNCQQKKVSGPFPDVLWWIPLSNYMGLENTWNIMANVWNFTSESHSHIIGVSPSNSSIPLWVRTITKWNEYNVVITSFDPIQPKPFFFNIPSVCLNSSKNELKCTSRSSIIDRGNVWVNNRVPYDQNGDYDGWREDCSGFVSMTWSLEKPGLTTSTLPSVSHKISKDELQAGDILLNEQEHVVLFAGWANTDRTLYIAMEETKPGEGTVKRVTPYPYWYDTSLFIPYRYNKVC